MATHAKRILASLLTVCMLITLLAAGIIVQASNPDTTLLYLDFSDAGQVAADSYSAFYSSRDVFTKHGDGSSAAMDMYVENGQLVIANKTGWARPVIRFSHAFEVGKTYRIEYTIAKADPNQSLSVEHLIQITGSLDGNWPTAPDVLTAATVLDGDSAQIALEFFFTEENGAITFHSGDYSAALPANAAVAAFDYAIVMGGESTGCILDDFKLIMTDRTESEPADEAMKVFDFETDGQMRDEYFDYTGNVIMKKGDGSSAVLTLGVENLSGVNGTATNALLVSGRTGWARPVVRLNLAFATGNTYRIAFLAKARETGKAISLYPYIEITGSLDGAWPTAAPLSGTATPLDTEGGWTKVEAEIVFAEDGGKLIYTCNGVTAELPAGAALAAVDLNIMAEGADSSADYYIDDLTITQIETAESGDGENEEQKPEVSGIVANSFHSPEEANQNVDGYMSGSGIWSFNGADGTVTLTVEESLLKITGRTGSRSVAVRLGGGDKFPSNHTYRMALRAKNLEAGKDQTLGYYIQFIGYQDGRYPVLDFGTDSVTLTDAYFLTVSAEFEIREENGVITIITENGRKSFEPGVTLAAIDVFLVTGGTDSSADIGIDNFYADYYRGEICLDFEDESHIHNVRDSHHSVAYTMTPNVYGASAWNLLFAEGAGVDGSTAMHAIGAPGNWRPQIRLSQGTARIKIGTPYELSFRIVGGNPEATTKFQILFEIYYTMPDAPSNYLNAQLLSNLVIVNGQWQTVSAYLILVETENGLIVTDGTAYRTIPSEAKIEAVDCGFLPIQTTDDQTDYYVDNFTLKKLLENPISMDGVADDADKIIKNGGMEDPANIGFGRAWAPSENADITLELVSYEAYAGRYSLKISDRKQMWHRAQQRLDDLTIFTEGKKFLLSGAVMSEEDTFFSLSIYVTLGFRDEENPSDINYAAMEIPLSTERVKANVWNDMAGEFGIFRNADGNLVITNGDTVDPVVLEIPADSVGIAAIDVWFTVAAGCEKNILTSYCIDNMEMIQSGTYSEGDALLCVFESVDADEDKDAEETLLYTDENTGIEIYGDASVIPAGAHFVIEMSASHAQAQKALNSRGIQGERFWTVKLVKDGEEVQPLGKLTVVIPAENAGDNQKLLLITDGYVLDPEAKAMDGSFRVNTDLLGVFALAAPDGSVKTGENTMLHGMTLLSLLSMTGLACLILLNKKKKGEWHA